MELVNQNVCEARHEAMNQYLYHNRQRLDAHSENIDQLQKLTVEIATLNQQITNMIQDHETRLRTIEQIPAKRWDALLSQVLSLLLAAILGGLLSQLTI